MPATSHVRDTRIGRISFSPEAKDQLVATDSLGDEVRRGAAEAGSGSDQGLQHFEVALDTMA
jgi:hypothetical protein